MKNFSTSHTLFSRNLSLNLDGRIMDLSTPCIMGIINATPDSFYSGSRLPDPATAVETAREMIDQGAHILDVGAVSSRPGAEEVSEQEEMERLSPVLEALRNEFPEIPISVDTWRSGVSRRVRESFGINMINDISAGQLDPEMFATVAELGIPYIMMHMQGTPAYMQEAPDYANVVDDLLQFFSERVHKLRKLGVNDIVIDPGFGFGKTLEQNYRLVRELHAFQMFELPLMAGLSRKSMIYKTLESDPDHALTGTTAAHMAVLIQGANLLRVHDVQAAAETVKIFQKIVDSPVRGV
ncbi:MAG: dihydropteroate synthase [Bacteroidales bacterium]|nr:dihydropteroate synthase [Bacteroidales bacterium]